MHGEYKFEPKFTDYIVVGANGRYYRPESDGTIFYDTAGTRISNYEYGVYTGLQKKFFTGKLITNAADQVRQKSGIFWYIMTPAASLVYSPAENNYIRFIVFICDQKPNLDRPISILKCRSGNISREFGWR